MDWWDIQWTRTTKEGERTMNHKSHSKEDIELCTTCACGTPERCEYDCAHKKPCYYYPRKEREQWVNAKDVVDTVTINKRVAYMV